MIWSWSTGQGQWPNRLGFYDDGSPPTSIRTRPPDPFTALMDKILIRPVFQPILWASSDLSQNRRPFSEVGLNPKNSPSKQVRHLSCPTWLGCSNVGLNGSRPKQSGPRFIPNPGLCSFIEDQEIYKSWPNENQAYDPDSKGPHSNQMPLTRVSTFHLLSSLKKPYFLIKNVLKFLFMWFDRFCFVALEFLFMWIDGQQWQG